MPIPDRIPSTLQLHNSYIFLLVNRNHPIPTTIPADRIHSQAGFPRIASMQTLSFYDIPFHSQEWA